ncbi:uncharacterized protein J3D65DRAFT_672538 [Phyllosticta citribraziliensis]|uniref:Uncharacterized protein n=1 Tax=Phyllosticta citribraziliensis TaxID=989973 RepID=A0ABR1L2Z5_9PEZI
MGARHQAGQHDEPADRRLFCPMNVTNCRPACGAHHSSLLIGFIVVESRKEGRRVAFHPERLCLWAPFANEDGSVKYRYRPMGSPFLILDQDGEVCLGLLDGTIILGGDFFYERCCNLNASDEDPNAICSWVIDKQTVSEYPITPYKGVTVPKSVILYASTPARQYLTEQNANLNGLVLALRIHAAPEMLYHYFRRLREEQGVLKLSDSKDAGASCALQASAVQGQELFLAQQLRSAEWSSWEDVTARGEGKMAQLDAVISYMHAPFKDKLAPMRMAYHDGRPVYSLMMAQDFYKNARISDKRRRDVSLSPEPSNKDDHTGQQAKRICTSPTQLLSTAKVRKRTRLSLTMPKNPYVSTSDPAHPRGKPPGPNPSNAAEAKTTPMKPPAPVKPKPFNAYVPKHVKAKTTMPGPVKPEVSNAYIPKHVEAKTTMPGPVKPEVSNAYIPKHVEAKTTMPGPVKPEASNMEQRQFPTTHPGGNPLGLDLSTVETTKTAVNTPTKPNDVAKPTAAEQQEDRAPELERPALWSSRRRLFKTSKTPSASASSMVGDVAQPSSGPRKTRSQNRSGGDSHPQDKTDAFEEGRTALGALHQKLTDTLPDGSAMKQRPPIPPRTSSRFAVSGLKSGATNVPRSSRSMLTNEGATNVPRFSQSMLTNEDNKE